ncbi:MAG TPA: GIY-YIG nuclease family protein [Leucothrix sp.]|nr:GIY-YIG nuclease family protein [Leucothrix sp.]
MTEQSNKELLDALGVEVVTTKKRTFTAKEERIIAGFEEIQAFVEEHDQIPAHGEGNDIFERLYAVRLDQIRNNQECRDLVQDMDHQDLLVGVDQVAEPKAEYGSDAELLAELGVEPPKEGDVTFLKHVKTRAEIRAAEEIANRTKCEDFDEFKPIFESVQKDIKSGLRNTVPYKDFAKVEQGDLFILSGQIVYIADVGEEYLNKNRQKDARLRVIYDNGTESDILVRSLQRALNKDEAGRRITSASLGPLFEGISDEDDIDSGTIYILRSLSDHSLIAENRDVIHKIGVTGSKVETRLSNAKLDPTFLMADVEVIATYELFNINRVKLESILHRFFETAKLNIEIMDRFGNPVIPQEWFLVPFDVIDQVVEKIKDGSIGGYVYDIESASIQARENKIKK